MNKKFAKTLTAILLAATTTATAWAQTPDPCQPTPVKLGPINPRNGFPLWVEDSRGVRTELCLDPGGVCFFDPVEPANPYSVRVGFGPEAFWFLSGLTMAYPANASVVDGVITLGVEAAWAAENPNPGDQFPFIRFRYRFDVLPEMGTYTLEHPWGAEVFDTVWVHDERRPERSVMDRVIVTYDSQFAAGAFTKGKIGPFPVPATLGSTYILPDGTNTFTLPPGFNQAANPGCSRTTFKLTGKRLCTDTNNDGIADGRGTMTMATCLSSVQGQPIDFDPSAGGTLYAVEAGNFTISSGKLATRVGVESQLTAYVKTSTVKGVQVFAKAMPKTGQPASNVVAAVAGTATEFPMSSDPKGRYFAFIPNTSLPGGFGGVGTDMVTVINRSDPNEDALSSNLRQSRVTTPLTDVVDVRTTTYWTSGVNANKLELVAKTSNSVDVCPLNAWSGITTGGSSTAKLKAFHDDGDFIADLTTVVPSGLGAMVSTTIPPHQVVIRSCFGGSSMADVEVSYPAR